LIKLAAFDVDGTLKEKEYLPASAAAALGKLRAAGVTLALCTGRSVYELAALRRELGIAWTIACNGSLVARDGEPVFGRPFEPSVIRRWLATAARLDHGVLLYGAHGMYVNRADDPLFRQAQAEIGMLEPEVLAPETPLPDIYQFIVFCSEAEEAAYLGERRDDVYVHRWRTWAVDFNPPGTNKSFGLRWLAEHLGVHPHEVAVFGDGINDKEMFQYAGIGIAMGNAVEEVKRIATHVTKPLREDGIAYAVDRWILPAMA
jgi:hypothetical protein